MATKCVESGRRGCEDSGGESIFGVTSPKFCPLVWYRGYRRFCVCGSEDVGNYLCRKAREIRSYLREN